MKSSIPSRRVSLQRWLPSIIFGLLLVVISTPLAFAQDNVWLGTTNNWNDPFNWSSGVPVADQHVLFDAFEDPTILGGSGVDVPNGATAGYVWLTGGDLANTATLNVPDGVTLTLTDTASYPTSYVGIGIGGAEDTGAGELNVSGSARIEFATGHALGSGDSVGSTGEINMTGTAYMNPAAYFGSQRGDAVFNISDNAELFIQSGTNAGGIFYCCGLTVAAGHDGAPTGTFNQMGGTVTVVDEDVTLVSVNSDTTGIYNMSDGTLTARSITLGVGDLGQFNFSGGTITLTDPTDQTAIVNEPWFNSIGGSAIANFDGSQTTIILGTVVDATLYEWNADQTGDLNTPGNWSILDGNTNALPFDNMKTAVLGSAITSPQLVYTNTPVTMKGMQFNNANTYAVGGNGTITFEADSGNASISVAQGSHQFQARVALGSHTDVNVASGSLDFNNEISTGGNNLALTGSVNINHSIVGGGTVSGSGALGTAGSTSIAANLDFDGTLVIDLGPNNTDFFDISGTATVSGTLDVVLENGFSPSGSYTVLTAATSLDASGLVLDASDTSTFNLVIMGNSVVLTTGLTCDFDGNGACDIDDIDALIMEISSGGMAAEFDLNGDGMVNLLDRDAWLAQAGAVNLASGNPYLVGDADLDGVVDVSDFNIWNNNKFTTTGKWSQGDFNADGSSDVSDFNSWNGNKFTSSDGVAAVPEPAAGILLLGFSALALWRRKR